ncbi:hypothetical protein AAMO2058_000587600 [Amorphochlora amoebiformis]|uniref:Protein kinase domain-containing protein n=1 Tax=Amorphochlora amoebiformis TaxID=1561963 RepID=A0A7S0DM61_9EUKA|mmetsp:Transcript_33097/g.53155  ORF Transcript_33097/g.53155 Transcript_33097/m.53155 type:complete len:996 (+) Transcript_33097:23-3010(+)
MHSVSDRKLIQGDRLGLYNREDVRKLLKKNGEDENSIQFTGNVIKINRHGRGQERRMLITKKSIYNLMPGSCVAKRVIDIKEIAGICTSTTSDEVLISIPGDYDYHLETELKKSICRHLRSLHHRLKGVWLPVHALSMDSLQSLAVTKNMAQEQRQKIQKRLMKAFADSAVANAQSIEDFDGEDEEDDDFRISNPDPSPLGNKHFLPTSSTPPAGARHSLPGRTPSPTRSGRSGSPQGSSVGNIGMITAERFSSENPASASHLKSGRDRKRSNTMMQTFFDSFRRGSKGAKDKKKDSISKIPESLAQFRVDTLRTNDTLNKKNRVQIDINPKRKSMNLSMSDLGKLPPLDHWNTDVSLKDFQPIRTIGESGYGMTVKVVRKATGDIHLLKLLKADEVFQNGKLPSVENERKVLLQVNHPFILRLHHSFQRLGYLGLVFQFTGNVDLYHYLQRARRFPEPVARLQVAEIALALGYLHKYGYAHRDVRPENILLDSEGHVKLTGFGLAKNTGPSQADFFPETDTFCGTIEYLAPEMLTNKSQHDMRVDWWSLGILLFEITVGIPPFYSRNIRRIYLRILNAKPRFPNYLSTHCKGVIRGLLEKNRKERTGTRNDYHEVLEAPFFQGFTEKKLVARNHTPLWNFATNVSSYRAPRPHNESLPPPSDGTRSPLPSPNRTRRRPSSREPRASRRVFLKMAPDSKPENSKNPSKEPKNIDTKILERTPTSPADFDLMSPRSRDAMAWKNTLDSAMETGSIGVPDRSKSPPLISRLDSASRIVTSNSYIFHDKTATNSGIQRDGTPPRLAVDSESDATTAPLDRVQSPVGALTRSMRSPSNKDKRSSLKKILVRRKDSKPSSPRAIAIQSSSRITDGVVGYNSMSGISSGTPPGLDHAIPRGSDGEDSLPARDSVVEYRDEKCETLQGVRSMIERLRAQLKHLEHKEAALVQAEVAPSDGFQKPLAPGSGTPSSRRPTKPEIAEFKSAMSQSSSRRSTHTFT